MAHRVGPGTPARASPTRCGRRRRERTVRPIGALRNARTRSGSKRLASEVEVGHDGVGLDRPSVINCDGIHTVSQRSLTTLLGRVSEHVMRRVCGAVSYALGC